MQAQAFEIDTGPNVTTSLESVAEFTSVYRTSSPERIERGRELGDQVGVEGVVQRGPIEAQAGVFQVNGQTQRVAVP